MAAKRKSSSGSGFGKFLLGFVCALVLAGGAAWWYLHRGATAVPMALQQHAASVPHPGPVAPEGMGPVQVHPKQVHGVPQPPFSPSEDAYETGAKIYRKRCAGCHGTPGRDAPNGLAMSPPALQLWGAGASAVGAQQPGALYLKLRNGIPKQGMPAYQNVIPDSEMWDIALLLQEAGQPLPDPVTALLNRK